MAIQGFNRGPAVRSAPRVRFVRGYDASSSHCLSETLPIKSGVTITSGDVLAKCINGTTGKAEWVLADSAHIAAGVNGSDETIIARPVYISKSDSSDTDVISANRLTAIPVTQPMEVATGRYVDGNYSTGDFLTVGTGATAGKIVELSALDVITGLDTNGSATITKGLCLGIVNNGVETWANALPADQMPSDADIMYRYRAADMVTYLGLTATAVWGTTNTGAGTQNPTPTEAANILALSGVKVQTNTVLSEANKRLILKGRYSKDYSRGTAINSEASGTITMLNFTTFFQPYAALTIEGA